MAPKRWRLSEEGRRRGVVLADRLGGYGVRAVFCSEEPKAVETAEIVAGRLGVWCSIQTGLHEHDRTGAPFLGDGEFDLAAKRFFDNPDELVWGNETAEQAGSRFEGAVRGVLGGWEGGVAVVAHGTVISLLIARYNATNAHDLWRRLGLPSFCVLSIEDFQLQETVPDLGT